MTATTSPAPTESPALTRTSLTTPSFSAADGVLHLHGLEQADGLADLDDVADRDEHLDDRALHRHGDLARPRAGDGGGGRPLRPAGRPGAADGRPQVGHPEAHRVPPPVDLGRHVALDGRHLLVARRRRGRPGGLGDEAAQVERLLDPLGRVLDRHEVGVAQDDLVGRQRRRPRR